MCLYPRMIKNPKYKANKKNGGIIPAVPDERAVYVPIGCSRCMECRKQKAREWQVRLMEDIKRNQKGRFITLTFSNESIKNLDDEIPETEIKQRWVNGVHTQKEIPVEGYERDNAIATRAVRLFLERWRKKYGKSLRHWLVTELGHNGTENIHLHGIVWQDEADETHWHTFMNEVKTIWGYGFVWQYKIEKGRKVNYVNEQTINYSVKYITKMDLDHKTYKSKVLTSAGIGKNYTEGQGNWTRNKFNNDKTDETYKTRSGHKIAMPIYWRNKIYTEKEKELLWLSKLDKNERWVCGERVDISKSEREYYALLEYYRKLNTQLGYGNDRINWSRAKYEHERRKILLVQRTKAPTGGVDRAGQSR